MARSFIVYQGEDETPEFDLTEPTSPVHVIWPEIEAGGRAFRGESNTSSVPMRDEQGETGNELNLPSGLDHISLSRGSQWIWMDGPDGSEVVMARGRIGVKDYSRGRQKADRAREVVVQCGDVNEDLQGILVDAWSRPEETDVERVLALAADYLDGDPRATTTISTTYVAAGNTVTMPAKTYDGTSPHGILSEIAQLANKNFFVTVDRELWYDTWDSTTYPAGIRISDRPDEWDFESACSVEGVSVTDSNSNQGGGNVLAVQVTVGNFANRALYVGILYNGSDPTSLAATWHPNYIDAGTPGTGTALTLIASDSHAFGVTTGRVALFRLVNPALSTIGTSSVSCVVNSNSEAHVYAAVLAGVDQSTPEVDSDADTSTGSSSSIALSGGGFVLDLSGWIEANATVAVPTPTAGQSVIESELSDNSFGVGDLASTMGTGSAGTSTYSFGASHVWFAAAASIAEAEAGDVATFPPKWDVGPSSTEDGLQLRCGLRLYYGIDGAYVEVHDDTTHNEYWHSEESLYTSDPAIDDETKATALANAILDRRKREERTYNVSIGPLTEAHVGCIKYGQLINIKARAIPDADDQYVARRIGQLRWTTPRPGIFWARMQLDRPIKEEPYGVGPKTAMEMGEKVSAVIAAHTADTSDAHDASTISVLDTDGNFTGTNVEDVLDELFDAIGSGGGGAPLGWFDIRNGYGAVGDLSTLDTDAIGEAIEDMNAAGGGVLYLPGAGGYLYDSALPAITVPCKVLGDGAGGFPYGTGIGSRLVATSANIGGLSFSDAGFVLEDFAIVTDAGSTPSSGAGILSVDPLYARMRGLIVAGFYDNFDFSDSQRWSLTDSFIHDPVRYGLRIRGTDDGDQSVHGCYFMADTHDADAAIRQEGAGGLKITNTKINERGVSGGQFVDGISCAFASADTSVLLVGNTSIENVSGDAIDISASSTGSFYGVTIHGVQVGLLGNNTGRAVKLTASTNGSIGGNGTLNHVVIGDCTFRTSGTARAAMEFTNVEGITIGAVDLSGFDDDYTQSGSTNITVLGSGGGASDLDDLSDVTISSATADDDLRFNGSAWVNDARKWEAVTDGVDTFVWDGDDLVHDWST